MPLPASSARVNKSFVFYRQMSVQLNYPCPKRKKIILYFLYLKKYFLNHICRSSGWAHGVIMLPQHCCLPDLHWTMAEKFYNLPKMSSGGVWPQYTKTLRTVWCIGCAGKHTVLVKLYSNCSNCSDCFHLTVFFAFIALFTWNVCASNYFIYSQCLLRVVSP